MKFSLQNLRMPLALAAAAFALAIAFGSNAPATSTVEAAPSMQGQTCNWARAAAGARGHYYVAGAMDTDNNHFYFFGGLDQSGSVSNSLALLDASDADPSKASHGAARTAGVERFGAAGAYRGGPGTSVADDQKGLYFIGGADDRDTAEGENTVLFFPTKDGKVSVQPPIQVGGSLGDRLWAAAAYDVEGDALFVVGGVKDCAAADRPCQSSGLQTKYLTFDMAGAATWNTGPTSGIPNSTYGLSLVYDSTGKRLLAFGGTRDGSRNNSDVHALDLSQGPDKANSWTKLSTTGTAPALSFHTASYDPTNNWMVVSGGTTNGPLSDRESTNRRTYLLDLGAATPSWTSVSNADSETVGATGAYGAAAMSNFRHGGRNKFSANGNQNVSGNSEYLNCMAEPTEAPTQVPPTVDPGATPVPTDEVRPTATTPSIDPSNLCEIATNKVPAAVIAAAQANPQGIAGYDQNCNPNLPRGPLNPPRTWLSLRTPSQPFHPIFNSLSWKCGCP